MAALLEKEEEEEEEREKAAAAKSNVRSRPAVSLPTLSVVSPQECERSGVSSHTG